MYCALCDGGEFDFSLWVAVEDNDVCSPRWSPEVQCQRCGHSFYADEISEDCLDEEYGGDTNGLVAWFRDVAETMPNPPIPEEEE